ncbi:hypothetical protein DPMN_117780 [Dreissena polymorpha]|uniref:Uncharacterized protein n=1 Tax=Dreissena polymorpha TaxID=45954 RepID=A0A9D4GG74_DREPO|nr:hypothetical protein DPMN_117780 [Dreissena polymorpha]
MACLAKTSVLKCAIVTVAICSLPALFLWTTSQLSGPHIDRHILTTSLLQNNTLLRVRIHDDGALTYIPTERRATATTNHPEIVKHDEKPVMFKEGRLVTDVDCEAIFKRDKEEINGANTLTETLKRTHLQPNYYKKWTENCSSFKLHRGYITDTLSELEREFPVAFSILMYKDIEMFERLLRAIYRPQNFYCIHVDDKTSDEIFKAVVSITGCFGNVFIASQRIRVKWGKLSVLTPELVCMEDLHRRSRKWKYFINLTGQEFPLKSNFELVKILTAFNGSNDVEHDTRYTCIHLCNYHKHLPILPTFITT